MPKGSYAERTAEVVQDVEYTSAHLQITARTAWENAGAALVELIDLERECCAWIQFKVTRDPIAGEVDVLLIAEGEGEEVRRDVRLRVGLLEVRTPYGCGLRSMLSRAPIVSESQGRQTSPGS